MQHLIWDIIKQKLPLPTILDNKLIGGITCAADRTRPDACWVLGDRIVHLEIDEHSHHDRQILCELKKLDSANWGLSDFGFKHLPTWTVRFNCSEYDKRRLSMQSRTDALVDHLNELLSGSVDGWDSLRTNVTYMFYHTKSNAHIDAARNASMSIIVQKIVE